MREVLIRMRSTDGSNWTAEGVASAIFMLNQVMLEEGYEIEFLAREDADRARQVRRYMERHGLIQMTAFG